MSREFSFYSVASIFQVLLQFVPLHTPLLAFLLEEKSATRGEQQIEFHGQFSLPMHGLLQSFSLVFVFFSFFTDLKGHIEAKN